MKEIDNYIYIPNYDDPGLLQKHLDILGLKNHAELCNILQEERIHTLNDFNNMIDDSFLGFLDKKYFPQLNIPVVEKIIKNDLYKDSNRKDIVDEEELSFGDEVLLQHIDILQTDSKKELYEKYNILIEKITQESTAFVIESNGIDENGYDNRSYLRSILEDIITEGSQIYKNTDVVLLKKFNENDLTVYHKQYNDDLKNYRMQEASNIKFDFQFDKCQKKKYKEILDQYGIDIMNYYLSMIRCVMSGWTIQTDDIVDVLLEAVKVCNTKNMLQ